MDCCLLIQLVAIDWLYPQITVEVIEAMENDRHTAGSAAAVLNDCYFMSSEFSKVVFQHEYREANTVAHELAQLAKFNEASSWI